MDRPGIQAHGRRHFLRTSCLGCAGLAIGAGVLSLAGCSTLPIVKAADAGGEVRVPLSSFGEGSHLLVRVQRLSYDVLLVKLPEGGVRALYMRCTHEDQPLTATSSGLHCPSHGSRFALDGTVTEGPATTALRLFPVREDGDHTVIAINT